MFAAFLQYVTFFVEMENLFYSALIHMHKFYTRSAKYNAFEELPVA